MNTETSPFSQVRRILVLAFFFSGIIWLFASYFDTIFPGGFSQGDNSSSSGTVASSENDRSFRRPGAGNLALIGVALGNGIAASTKAISTVPVDLVDEALSISDFLSKKNIARADFIQHNMSAIQEYANILSVNVRALLAQSPDRSAVLESYIDQLKFRYSSTSTRISELSNQVAGTESALNALQKDMENIKKQIAGAYDRFDAGETQKRLQEYLEKQETYIYSRSYLVFAQKFSRSYQRLNAFNQNLLDVLVNNRDALIKNATVVIPDSGGASLLRSLDLVESESDAKN